MKNEGKRVATENEKLNRYTVTQNCQLLFEITLRKKLTT